MLPTLRVYSKKLNNVTLFILLIFLIPRTLQAAPGEDKQAYRIQQQLKQFVFVPLPRELSSLSPNQRRMIPLLEEAAWLMDGVFWQQAYGNKAELFKQQPDEESKRLLSIHYGPWDRYNGNRPLFPGGNAKPPGANFYPADMSQQELTEAARHNPALTSPYTMVRRDDEGNLIAIPYHHFFAHAHQQAANKLRQAAQLADDDGFRHYLTLRADALLTDNYQPSDIAWMAMKNNTLDLIIGPIEIYEDSFGYKASHEAFLLRKDSRWSQRLKQYTTLLPLWQKALPVAPAYKKEQPGSESDLGAYDLLLTTGDAAATRSIAVHLPNDEAVQLKSGSRRLQLKNAMKAKFDHILRPIAQQLIHPDQRSLVRYEPFFSNTMLHEVAHGLGIKNLLDKPNKTVRSALKELTWMLEEGKADAVGLFIASQLRHSEGWEEPRWQETLVTSFASLFRSIRFGPTSAHARANLIRFNYLKEKQAFSRSQSGLYQINPAKMEQAISALIGTLLTLQGHGDYEGVVALEKRYGTLGPQLDADLKRLALAEIPLDVVFVSSSPAPR
ncbi:MAG: Zn-dependent hydrolase [Magnetococcales bacterium]|nr:Zn-dependent hydrolase [Magnetococcales bacterium]